MDCLQLKGSRKTKILNTCHIKVMRIVIKRRESKSTSSMDIIKRKRKTAAQEACPTTIKKNKDAIHHEPTAFYPYMLKPQKERN